jgi:hypothetical protein
VLLEVVEMERTAVEDWLIQSELDETFHLFRLFEMISRIILQLDRLFSNLL